MEIVIGILFVVVVIAMLVIPRKKEEVLAENAPYKVEVPVVEAAPEPAVEVAPVEKPARKPRAKKVEEVAPAPVVEAAPAKKPRAPRKPKAQ